MVIAIPRKLAVDQHVIAAFLKYAKAEQLAGRTPGKMIAALAFRPMGPFLNALGLQWTCPDYAMLPLHPSLPTTLIVPELCLTADAPRGAWLVDMHRPLPPEGRALVESLGQRPPEAPVLVEGLPRKERNGEITLPTGEVWAKCVRCGGVVLIVSAQHRRRCPRCRGPLQINHPALDRAYAKMDAARHDAVAGAADLSIVLPSPAYGDVVQMWNPCLICGAATPATVPVNIPWSDTFLKAAVPVCEAHGGDEADVMAKLARLAASVTEVFTAWTICKGQLATPQPCRRCGVPTRRLVEIMLGARTPAGLHGCPSGLVQLGSIVYPLCVNENMDDSRVMEFTRELAWCDVFGPIPGSVF